MRVEWVVMYVCTLVGYKCGEAVSVVDIEYCDGVV